MNKYGYVLAAVSANIVVNTAVASEVNQVNLEFNNSKDSYIKLASINPIVESEGNFVMQERFDLSTPIDPSNPTDPNHPVNISCVTRGYEITGSCPAGGDCIPDYCPENNAFMKCTCFCAVNECTEQGYLEQTCTKYQNSSDCPFLPNLGYVKCEEMELYEKCIVDGYIETSNVCTGYKKAEYCSFDNSYLKCVDMTDYEKCQADGYTLSSCPAGETLTDKCPHGDENLYLRCEVKTCDANYVSSCSAGYVLDSSDSCTDASGTKYNCVPADCIGYDLTSPCSPADGFTETTCLSGATTKYKCVPNACTGYDQTSPCSPASGYTETTCQSGSTTKYKCVPNACVGYDLTSPCSPADGYVQTTCLSGSTTKYKCTPNPCVGYDSTIPCNPLGYTETTCLSGTTTKYKCTQNACGGYYTTCPVEYIKDLTDTCLSGTTTKYKCILDCSASACETRNNCPGLPEPDRTICKTCCRNGGGAGCNEYDLCRME